MAIPRKERHRHKVVGRQIRTTGGQKECTQQPAGAYQAKSAGSSTNDYVRNPPSLTGGSWTQKETRLKNQGIALIRKSSLPDLERCLKCNGVTGNEASRRRGGPRLDSIRESIRVAEHRRLDQVGSTYRHRPAIDNMRICSQIDFVAHAISVVADNIILVVGCFMNDIESAN